MVNGNAGELTQVILNLAKNAAEAIGDRGGRVRLATKAESDRVHVVVEDDGPGIPEHIRDSLFRPFERGPSATPHAPGIGLGLSLVARFAELQGGRAWVEERPGGGASFHVVLASGDEGRV